MCAEPNGPDGGRRLRVLIIGAGALGQVFACHLGRGGARVHLLVRSRRREPCAGELWLWRVRRLGSPAEVRFRPSGVFDDTDRAARERWDVVILCVASTAFREDVIPWLARIAGGATVVAMGHAARDVAVLRHALPAEQVVFIVPALLAWAAQAPDGGSPAGTAYWVPPLAAALRLDGTPARTGPVVEALRRGGLRARLTRGASADGVRRGAIAIPYVAALEASGWSIGTLRRTRWLELAAGAAGEAASLTAARRRWSPLARLARMPRMARLALGLVSLLAPFDLERYLAQHFTKVRPQTLMILRDLIAEGRERGLPTAAVEQLAETLLAGPQRPRLPG